VLTYCLAFGAFLRAVLTGAALAGALLVRAGLAMAPSAVTRALAGTIEISIFTRYKKSEAYLGGGCLRGNTLLLDSRGYGLDQFPKLRWRFSLLEDHRRACVRDSASANFVEGVAKMLVKVGAMGTSYLEK
jgi:hypothetical protein